VGWLEVAGCAGAAGAAVTVGAAEAGDLVFSFIFVLFDG
jgi:hypothetical protein